jgi:hypothetical protein
MIKYLKVFIIIFTAHFLSAGDIIGIMNNEFYTNGESVKGSIKFINLLADGKALKYTLLDVNKRSILTGFSKVKDNNASFNFDLDYKLSSGVYHVDFTALDKAYIETVIISFRFLLINPTEEIVINDYKTTNQFYTKSIKQSNLLTLEKKAESLSIGGQGMTVISVSQAPYNLLNLDMVTNIEQSKIDSWQGNIFFNGTLVRGELPTAQSILGLYSLSNDKFYMTKTLPNGNFIFSIDDFIGNNNYQLFPYAEKYTQLSYKRNNPVTSRKYEETDFPAVKLKMIIEDIKNRSAINQYFGVVMPIKSPIQNVRKEQELKIYKKYIPSNYKVFTYFHQFCKENSLPILFEEVENKFKASCLINSSFSKKFNSSSDNPLFIVNGIATRNYDALAKIPTAEIEFIELYMDFEKQRKYYNVYGGDPVIKLKTKTNDNLLSKIEHSNFMTIQGFNEDYNDDNLFISYNKSKNIKPILEPKVFFGKMQQNLVIPLPDVKGEIEVIGLQLINGEWNLQRQAINI